MKSRSKIILKNKVVLYSLVFFIIFILYLIYANKIVASIFNRSYPLKEINLEEIEVKDAVYYGLDTINYQNDFAERVNISGWAFCETEYDNSDKEKYVVLVSTDKSYIVSGTKSVRSDIQRQFSERGYKTKGTNSGFDMLFSTVDMENGIYEICLYIKENEQNYGFARTGNKFYKNNKEIVELKNEPVEIHKPIVNDEAIKFNIDGIVFDEGNLTIKGWGTKVGAEKLNDEMFLCIENNGEIRYFEITTGARKDIANAFGEEYMYSGINCNIPLGYLENGELNIYLVLNNNGNLYQTSVPKKYYYDFYNGTIQETIEKGVVLNGTIEENKYMRMRVDGISVNGNTITFTGWGVNFKESDMSKVKQYVELVDSQGQVNVFASTPYERTDIAKAFGEGYLVSGVQIKFDKRLIAEGTVEIRQLTQVDDKIIQRSTEVLTVEYDGNSMELVKGDEIN